MKLFIILLLFFPFMLFAQQEDAWIKKLEKPEYPVWALNSQNVKGNYLKHDFSHALKPNTIFLGFIGPPIQKAEN
jgi:hypothetical protein